MQEIQKIIIAASEINLHQKYILNYQIASQGVRILIKGKIAMLYATIYGSAETLNRCMRSH